MIERCDKRRRLAAVGLALLGLAAPAAVRADDCTGLISLDRAARLSVDDLGRVMAMGDRLVEHRFVRVDTFRPDARPVRGGRTALAIAGAGGEAGEASFVGVLWTARPELFAADAVVIVPAAAGAARIEARASGACGVVWRLELSTDGVVRVNGARAARLVTVRASPAAPETIGGLIWVKNDVSLLSDPSASVVREGDRLVLTVEVGEVSRPDGPARCESGYVLTLDDRGVLTAGGVEVGRAKAP